MRIRATLAVFVLVLTLAVTKPVEAQYTGGPYCELISSILRRLQTTIIYVGGFKPGTIFTITIHSDPWEAGKATVGADGKAQLAVTIPGDFPLGRHTIHATGTGADGSAVDATTDVTVIEAEGVTQPAPPSRAPTRAAGTLPRTGSSTALPVRVAIALLAVGAVLVLANRKQREPATR